jgi:hypothetical protein
VASLTGVAHLLDLGPGHDGEHKMSRHQAAENGVDAVPFRKDTRSLPGHHPWAAGYTNTTRQSTFARRASKQKGDASRLVAGRVNRPPRHQVRGRRFCPHGRGSPAGGKRGADGVVERTSGDGGDGTKPGWGKGQGACPRGCAIASGAGTSARR